MNRARRTPADRKHPEDREERESRTIPVVEEQVDVTKEEVLTGSVRIDKRVSNTERVIETPIIREEVDVRRVAVNEIVEEAPAIRREGDTLIMPVLEEVVVVEKRLMLRELLYVTTTRTEELDRQTVTLQREDVEVARDGERTRD